MLPKQLSDEMLLARVARGDASALEMLYDHHAATVLGICLKITGNRVLAEDLLQETFWRVWRSAPAFQPERGSFTSWLFRIARNLAIDAYRRQKIRPNTIMGASGDDPIFEQLADSAMDVPEQAQSNIDAQQVRKALTILPREQRQVIEMAYFQGMTRQEIAESTGEALGTIHTRARLGLRKLREELQKSMQIE